MNLIKITENIIQVDFETSQELLKTFVRFQEFYESPEFKGKVFTIKEYAEWYKSYYKKEIFTYYDDWAGCNVPGYVFEFFRKGNFNPLSERETMLLEKLPNNPNIYVIGTFQGGKGDVLDHEICHGLYYTNPSYKKEIDEELNKNNEKTKEVRKYIEELGYHQDVVQDEIHAYLSASSEDLEKKNIYFCKKMVEKLNSIRNKYK